MAPPAVPALLPMKLEAVMYKKRFTQLPKSRCNAPPMVVAELLIN